MNVRNWLIQLYPHNWRERYGEEFDALLDDCPLSSREVLDVITSALDAWFHPVSESSSNWRPANMNIFAHKKDVVFVASMVIAAAILDISLMAFTAFAYFEGMALTAVSIATMGVIATLGFVAIAARKIYIARA